MINLKSFAKTIALFAGAAIIGYGSPALSQEAKKVRIGWQKGVFNEAILKAEGSLERMCKDKGIEVQWVEFQVGPPMMEALNVGSLDIAAAANTPPIFAQVAGADMVYVAAEAPTPGDQQILVRKDSNIHTAQDLVGKKVAIPKGSMAHYMVIKYMESNGLKFSDVVPAYLSPADGRASLESGAVAAWAAFDPLMAGAEAGGQVRVLADGFQVKVNNRQMYFARREFAEKNPQLIKQLVDEVRKTSQYIYNHTAEVAAKHAGFIGLDQPTFKTVLDRNKVNEIISPLNEEVIKEQQALADTFHRLKITPKVVDIRKAVWTPSN